MIRILHTADWHLGQVFHGYDRDFEHKTFLDWLLRALVERQIDVLLIAGDIFDTVNPSAIAQRRFFNFLADAHAALPDLQTVVTAGNHDAGARLEAPAGLLERMKITVVGTVTRDASGVIDCGRFLVPLMDRSGSVAALALAIPFLRPSDVPMVAESSTSYLDGIHELYRAAVAHAEAHRRRECPGAPLIALGHCHLQDSTESRDSERRVVIGGAEALPVATFPSCLAYVALGHLHKPQELDRGRIRYSGSPLPLSFSEKDYPHRVVEITLGGENEPAITEIRIPKTASLRCIPPDKPAPIAEVLHLLARADFPAGSSADAHPFLEVRVLDDGPDPTRRRRIEEALENKAVRLASIKLEPPVRQNVLEETPMTTPTLSDLSELDPVEVMTAAHRDRFQSEPDAALLKALREILSQESSETTSVLR